MSKELEMLGKSLFALAAVGLFVALIGLYLGIVR